MNKEELLDLLKQILVVKVNKILPHPNADRLKLVEISFGNKMPETQNPINSITENEFGEKVKTVITGATNMEEGDFVPFLGEGNVIPGYLILKNEKIVLSKKNLRGIESDSMILAEDEIGLGVSHEGLLILNELDSSSLKLAVDNNLLGESLVNILSESMINKIFENAGIKTASLDDLKKLEGLKEVTEEILGEDTLIELLNSGEEINHYIGFEISGLVHLGTGIMTGLVLRELQKLGVKTKIFLADWHTWMNNKLNGDHELIKKVAMEYFAPAMKISAQIAGADPEKIEFVLGSNLYDKNNRYWQSCIEISKELTLSRVIKSTTILGREESEGMIFAYLFYPIMQVADIFEMENHIAHAGTDQRKCHVIAREVATKLNVHPLLNKKGEKLKPIAIHHSLVNGLQAPSTWPLPENVDIKQMLTTLKMSKSVEDSAIFIHDTPEQIRKNISKAFCPEKEIGYNPILNWIKHMIFPILGKFELKREEKLGGNRVFQNYTDLETAYAAGEVYPLDLKNNVAEIFVELLAPAREVFNTPEKSALIEVIKSVKKKR